MKVKRIHLYTLGDPSAGITGESATITADGEFLFDTDDFEQQQLDAIIGDIADALSYLWGGNAYAHFDYEVDREEG